MILLRYWGKKAKIIRRFWKQNRIRQETGIRVRRKRKLPKRKKSRRKKKNQRRKRKSQRRKQSLRSEEHTSELQSLMRISYAVFCLKKKKKQNHETIKQEYLKKIKTQ